MRAAGDAPTASCEPDGWLPGRRGDALLYAASAVMAAGLAVATSYHGHRLWGLIASAGYALGAAASLVVVSRWRAHVAGAVFVVAGLLPLGVLLAQRARHVPWSAQPEVPVVERSARLLLDHGTPYSDVGALGRQATFEDYTPYLPGMSVFGLPRALLGDSALTDARVAFAVTAAVLVLLGVWLLRPATIPVRAAQLVAVLPATTLTLATGGDDLPVLALLLLALVLAGVGRPVAAGAAGGAALAMKLTAVPVLVVLAVALLAGTGRRSAALFGAVAAGVATAVVLPVTLVAPGALVEHVVRFPAGLTDVASPAASPLPGHLIAGTGPAGRAVAITLLAAAAVAILVWLLRRPPTTVAEAADRSAVALLVAMLLMPATRYGYAVYPLALVGAAIALRMAGPDRGAGSPRSSEAG